MLLWGIDPKIYCKLERVCFILRMFWNTEFTRKIQSFKTPTFQFKQWFTKCIKSTMFHFLAFYSLEYTRSDDTKFMILFPFQPGVSSWFIWCIVHKNGSCDVKYKSRFWSNFFLNALQKMIHSSFSPKGATGGNWYVKLHEILRR